MNIGEILSVRAVQGEMDILVFKAGENLYGVDLRGEALTDWPRNRKALGNFVTREGAERFAAKIALKHTA